MSDAPVSLLTLAVDFNDPDWQSKLPAWAFQLPIAGQERLRAIAAAIQDELGSDTLSPKRKP